ncbi:protein ALP1-like [Sesamum indicum]|uniref:Protein ALP1-like n=1 Tax=Sesamum indicum TaxID=4182 RepID=A0A6I9TWT0_SESIN|nr:protein ALP1-like [Sesamum indicum]XP_011088236.1 protein ALP1-like [Sesamum indicum]
MNSRALAPLLSSLISQLLVLIFLLFPAPNPLTITNSAPFSTPRRDFQESLFPLLHHFLSTSGVAATLCFLSFSRKRKRARFQGLDDPDNEEDPGSRLGRLGSVVSRNPESFKQFFRMKTSTFEWLCGLLEPLLECRDPVDSPLNLPAEARLGIGLYRLATGADYPEISGRFGVSEADAKFCVKHLCRVLCTNYRFWVGFPSPTELDSVSARFETLIGLPNCCGIISCTRFNIERANGSGSITQNDADHESIAAQIVVDSSSRILSVVAGFRGNKSNIQILKSSTLYQDIRKGILLNSSRPVKVNEVAVPQYLVGSGEYDLLPWLLVPFLDPKAGSVEESFNNVHRLMLVSSLKTMASLRNWGVLDRPMKMDYKSAVACIGACSILHNMLIMREDDSAFCYELDDQVVDNQNIASLGGNYVEENALVIRKALATRAKR